MRRDYMQQLSLFDQNREVIPQHVVSPLESTKNKNSKAFKEEKEVWRRYVTAVQQSYNCSWFQARRMVMDHRDTQIPIDLRNVNAGGKK